MLKKLLVIIIVVLFSHQAFAIQLKFTGPGNTSLDASSIDKIKITNKGENFNVGEYNFDLPEKNALSDVGLNNESTAIRVRCYSDADTTWTLKIRSSGFLNTNNSSITIPLQWKPVYAGLWNANKTSVEAEGVTFDQSAGGNWIDSNMSTKLADSLKQKAFIAFDNLDQTVYISNTLDKNHKSLNNSDGTEIQIQLGVIIPENQTAGTYTADLEFTLTE